MIKKIHSKLYNFISNLEGKRRKQEKTGGHDGKTICKSKN